MLPWLDARKLVRFVRFHPLTCPTAAQFRQIAESYRTEQPQGAGEVLRRLEKGEALARHQLPLCLPHSVRAVSAGAWAQA